MSDDKICDMCHKKYVTPQTHIIVTPPKTKELFIYKVCNNCAKKIFNYIDELEESYKKENENFSCKRLAKSQVCYC